MGGGGGGERCMRIEVGGGEGWMRKAVTRDGWGMVERHGELCIGSRREV